MDNERLQQNINTLKGYVQTNANGIGELIERFDEMDSKMKSNFQRFEVALTPQSSNSNSSQSTETLFEAGNMGASQTFDRSTATTFTGTLDDDTVITFSNISSLEESYVVLSYDGTAQRSPSYIGIDEWANGVAPTSPTSTSRELHITAKNVGGTVYGFHSTGNASSGVGTSDHGALTGLTDDDHTQYWKRETGTGAPSAVPTRAGILYYDSQNQRYWLSHGSTDFSDWRGMETFKHPNA